MSSTPTQRRVVAWFSCGVTSAVAAKFAVQEYDNVHVVYCDTGSEHHDNRRFLHDVELWLDRRITILRSDEYRDIWDVFRRERWLVGVNGARCTTELKKRLRMAYEQADDIQVFGYDADEASRGARFVANNPDVEICTPLIDRGLTKPDCMAIVQDVGIELPAMYKLGFPNANCVGCVKGGAGYWNHVRKVFPETFNAMARMEREIGASICKVTNANGERARVYLDELDPHAGTDAKIILPDCGLLCAIAQDDILQGERDA